MADGGSERERLLELFRSMQGDMVPSVMRAFDQDDLQLVHSAVLSVVGREGGPPTLNELAAEVGRSVSRTSRIVEQLVGRGLLERREDASDRRVRRIVLTDEGRELVWRVQRFRVESLGELIDRLTDAERQQVMAAMETLTEAARRLADDRRAGIE